MTPARLEDIRAELAILKRESKGQFASDLDEARLELAPAVEELLAEVERMGTVIHQVIVDGNCPHRFLAEEDSQVVCADCGLGLGTMVRNAEGSRPSAVEIVPVNPPETPPQGLFARRLRAVMLEQSRSPEKNQTGRFVSSEEGDERICRRGAT